MKEYREGIYKRAGIGPVVAGFVIVIFVVLIGALMFFVFFHPKVPVYPQPKNNKGQMVMAPDGAVQV